MLNLPSFISPSPSAPPLPPAAARAPAPSAPAAQTVVTFSDYDTIHHLAVDMPAEIGDADAAPEIKGLWAAIRSDGFVKALTDRLSSYMEPGSASRKMLDKTGIFNVNQIAIEIPMIPFGLSGKYGVQINIVKPDVTSFDGTYHLQLFPIHDEIDFNLPNALSSLLPKDFLPAWCGLSAQIIRNHGFNIPFAHTDMGWKFGGYNSVDYLEEWVIRPLELDLKYMGSEVPVQATIGLELGAHFKWSMNHPKLSAIIGMISAANVAGSQIGMLFGAMTPGTPAAAVHPAMHGGAMLGQLAMHGAQCCFKSLRPDQIVTWAGATYSAGDINLPLPSDYINRLTEYPRIWSHVHDGCWNFKEQAEAAVAPIIRRAENIRATEMAEMGIDNSAFPRDTPLSTVRERVATPISERYAAQRF